MLLVTHFTFDRAFLNAHEDGMAHFLCKKNGLNEEVLFYN